MSNALPRLRIYAMIFLYLLTGLSLGITSWITMFGAGADWDPIEGVAFSFWTAISTLALLGARFPVKMLPILLIQFSYKSIWLTFVALPLWQAGKMDPMSDELFRACALGVIFDLLIIPWPYVFREYVLAIFRFGTKTSERTAT